LKQFSIRPFEQGDIDFAHKLNMMEHWNDTRNDIKRIFSYEPNGCFIATINNEPAGHVFSINYGRLGWIGLLIVSPKHRRKGVGTLLLNKAKTYLLTTKAKTVRLEAEPTIAHMYRKLGFFDEYDSLRFTGVSKKTKSSSNHYVKPLRKEDVAKLAEFDAEHFGANRIKVLRGLYQDNPQFCFVSHKESKVSGYIIHRETEDGYRIGPWVCNSENQQVAGELLMKCLESIGQNKKLYVGVPAPNKTAIQILQDLNFEQYSKSIRMYFGKKLETEQVDHVFAIGGPEKG